MTYKKDNVQLEKLADYLNDMELVGWNLVSVTPLPHLAGRVMVITHKENDEVS